MTATRPTIVTAAYAAAITQATLDLAERIRALTGDSAREHDGHDQAAALAEDFITQLSRWGWRPTNATAIPDRRSPRCQPPDVARRGAASARELLSRTTQDTDEPGGTR